MLPINRRGTVANEGERESEMEGGVEGEIEMEEVREEGEADNLYNDPNNDGDLGHVYEEVSEIYRNIHLSTNMSYENVFYDSFLQFLQFRNWSRKTEKERKNDF